MPDRIVERLLPHLLCRSLRREALRPIRCESDHAKRRLRLDKSQRGPLLDPRGVERRAIGQEVVRINVLEGIDGIEGSPREALGLVSINVRGHNPSTPLLRGRGAF